jgi:hypothetical protein
VGARMDGPIFGLFEKFYEVLVIFNNHIYLIGNFFSIGIILRIPT